jgi:hypothetical protein
MHTINLTTAWDCIELPGSETVWGRQFGRPTGIEPPLQVWLVAQPDVLSRCWLNGNRLTDAAEQGCGLQITDRLTVRNLLLLPPLTMAAESISAIITGLMDGRLVRSRSPLPADLGRVMLTITTDELDFRLS